MRLTENDSNQTMTDLVERLATLMLGHNFTLGLAESCTGGWLAAEITALAGSSHWFDRGYVTYSNRSKTQLLGVKQSTLDAHGAVSNAVVDEMTKGVIDNGGCNIAIAISGIAGPDGGTLEKPVGTVYLAWRLNDRVPVIEHHVFAGDRESVRRQSVQKALTRLIGLLENGWR